MTTTDELISTALDPTAASFRRRMAIPELARAEDPRALSALTRLLDDEDRYLRREVVAALARQPAAGSVAPLLKALHDRDDYIRRDAIEALGRMEDPRAIVPLQALARDAPYAVRDAAQRALQELHRRGVRPAAQTAAQQPEPPVREDSPVNSRGPVSPAARTVPADQVPVPAAALQPPRSAEPELPDSEIAGPEIAEPMVAEPMVAEPMVAERQIAAPESGLAEISAPDIAPAAVSPAAQESSDLPESPDDPSAVAVAPRRRRGTTPGSPDDPSAVAQIPLPAAECYLSAIPPDFAWQQACRLQAFFAGDLPPVQPLYEQLRASQHRLRELEQQYQQAFLACGLHRADQEDDLARCETALQTARGDLARHERSLTRAERERTLLQAQAESVWQRWLGVFQPQRLERNQQLLTEIVAAQQTLQEKDAATREEIQTLEQQREAIAQPIQRAQDRLESLRAARESAVDEIRDLDRQIDAQYQQRLLNAALPQRQECLQRCAQLVRDPAFFQLVGGRLLQAFSQWEAAVAEQGQVERQRQEQAAAAGQSLERLSQILAGGFRITQAARQTSVRLKGSLQVREQHGVFQGFSGADGWASGTGTGEAVYELQEIAWTAEPRLPDAARLFAEAWTAAGQSAARNQHALALLAARQETAAEYLRFLRAELEQDFAEGQP